MIKLLIDTRESNLNNLIKERDLDKYNDKITISSEQLDLGDINIIFEDKKYILERKTIADLIASVKDGRYKEQKARLLSSQYDITYIIEGDDILSTKQLKNQTLLSSIYIHSMYRDNIKFIFTKNIEDTCTYILTLCAKIIENPEYFIKENNNNDEYIDCIKIKSKKIDNITPNVCYISQLAQIPSISTVIAKNIQKYYQNMPELIKALDNLNDKNEKIELLCKIDKIGKEKANKIIEYLYGF